MGHAGAEAQSNYFFEKTTAFYQNPIGATTGTTKSENKRGECQSDGIGWRIVVSWHQLHQGFDIELVTLEDRCRN